MSFVCKESTFLLISNYLVMKLNNQFFDLVADN